MRLGSAIAIAKAGSYFSDSTSSPGTSIYFRCGPKKKKKNTGWSHLIVFSSYVYPLYLYKDIIIGIPLVVQWLTNPTRNHEVEGLIPGFAQWVKDPALP